MNPNLHNNVEDNVCRELFFSSKTDRSLLVWIFLNLSRILSFINIPVLCDLIRYCIFNKKKRYLVVPELYVILQLFIQTLFLFVFNKNIWMLVIAIYVLVDILAVTMRDIIISPQINRYPNGKGGFIRIRHKRRWLILSFLNTIQIVFSFAMLFLHYGSQFKPNINSQITAIYQSTLTFTTLGYGEIKPTSSVGMVIVCLELLYFLIFLIGKVPIAVSVINVERAKESTIVTRRKMFE